MEYCNFRQIAVNSPLVQIVELGILTIPCLLESRTAACGTTFLQFAVRPSANT